MRVHSENALLYAHQCEQMFTTTMSENGYERKTTFFADLSIAELHGGNMVCRTFRKIVKEWGKNVVYFTEFVMCLNHKIWQHYYQGNIDMAREYDDLWRKAARMAEDNFDGKELDYYRTTN